MSVTVSPISIISSPGTAPVNPFIDSFNRASNADLGPNWIDVTFKITPIVDPINSAQWFIAPQVDATQGINVGTVGNNNPGTFWPSMIAALPTRVVTLAKNQFVQAQLINRAGPSDFCGPCLLINDQMADCYVLTISGVSPSLVTLRRVNQATASTINSFGNIALANDTFRISAIINPGDVTLTVLRNGVSLGAFVDANAARLTAGYSGGFYAQFMNQTGGVISTQQWRNFSCGTGS